MRKNSHHSEETKLKMSEARKGKKYSEESKRKIGEALKGRKFSEEHKRKISEANRRRKHLEETKLKMSEKAKERKGENSPNWQGGKSFEPYTVDWTQTLKRSIRERDHYICQICKKIQGDITFDVHHIDRDKKNCKPDNLITLCRNCHNKTNHNRKKWGRNEYTN